MFRIFGRDPAQGIPNPEGRMSCARQSPRTACLMRLARQSPDGTPYELELMTVSAKPGTSPLLRQRIPERDASGRVVRLAGLLQDITERKQAEQAFSHPCRKNRALDGNTSPR
ncbi:MAG: PAS domain-containing protein [Rhodoferax sp.]|nr:PAS domain-containing protein [Rhodoferax sp.]